MISRLPEVNTPNGRMAQGADSESILATRAS